MKVCPTCTKAYEDDDINFCLVDGSTLRTLRYRDKPGIIDLFKGIWRDVLRRKPEAKSVNLSASEARMEKLRERKRGPGVDQAEPTNESFAEKFAIEAKQVEIERQAR